MNSADIYNNKLKDVFHIQVPNKEGKLEYVKRIYKNTIDKNNIIWQQKQLIYLFRDNIPVTVTYDINDEITQRTMQLDDSMSEKLMKLVSYGDISYSNSILTNFSLSNYARLSSVLNFTTTTSFEIILKLKTGSNTNVRQEIFSLSNSSNVKFGILNNKLYWDYCKAYGNSTLAENTVYFIKIVKNYNTFKAYISSDGVNYNLDIDSTADINIMNQYVFLGIDKSSNEIAISPFFGEFDLSQCMLTYDSTVYHIVYNAQIVDNGFSDQQFEIIENTFEKYGYNFICWNTSQDLTGKNLYPGELYDVQDNITLYAKWEKAFNYIQLIQFGDLVVESNAVKQYNYNSYVRTASQYQWNNNFEIVLKIKTSSDVSTKQVIWRLSEDSTCNVCLYKSKLCVEYTNAVSNTMFNSNESYYIKIEKNGSALIISSSTNGTTYTVALETNINATFKQQYFTFGYNYSYTAINTLEYQQKIEYTEPVYETQDHWYTNNECMYADKNQKTYTYEQKLKHASKDKNKEPSNKCGYWGKIETIVSYETKYIYETKTKQEKQLVTVANFDGEMDFNESYIILNGTTYKLKV